MVHDYITRSFEALLPQTPGELSKKLEECHAMHTVEDLNSFGMKVNRKFGFKTTLLVVNE
jgi:hypothetical protein